MTKAPYRLTPRLLIARDAAQYIGISETHLRDLVADGAVPQPKRISERRVAWDRLDLDAYVDGLSYGDDVKVDEAQGATGWEDFEGAHGA